MLNNLEKLKMCCLTIGNLPSSYLDSMTYEEQILWLCKFINENIIPAINNNNEQVNKLTSLVNELTNYINNLDLQDEVNNKIDELLENGTLEDIMIKILNSLKTYNNINEMINDNTLTLNQKCFSMGYNNNLDGGSSYYIITEKIENGNNLTKIDLANGLQAQMIYDKEIFIADVTILNDNLINELLNNGTILKSNDNIIVNSGIKINNNNLILKNMKFECNTNGITLITLNGNNINIDSCYFTGSCGEYVRITGKNSSLINSVLDATNCNGIHGIFINGINNNVLNNKFIDMFGFNIQTLQSKHTTISNNTFENNHTTGTYIAQGGESVITLIVDNYLERKITKVNGNTVSASYNYNQTTKQLTITLTGALNQGDVVTFRGYKSLECLNINANSYDINITNNSLIGTGDSAIVIASDYHNGELNPSAVVSTDLPKRVNISNNTITDCAYAGIAINNPCKYITISSNIITNCGFLLSDITNNIFSSGILFNIGSYPITISNNSISNIVVSDGLNETENGIMNNGIYINPTESTNLPSLELNEMNNKIYIKNNIFHNLNFNIKFLGGATRVIQGAPDMDTYGEIIYPEFDGATTTNNYYALALNNTNPLVLDTENPMLGINSIKIPFTATADRYLNINPRGIGKVNKNYILDITFWAKASNENATVQIYEIRNDVSVNPKEKRLTTDWKLYHFSVLSNDYNTFLMRFANINSQAVNINFSHLRFKFIPINN